VHSTSHAFKVKQTQYCISIGTVCTRACHAQWKELASMMLHEDVPQAFLQQPPSLAESLMRRRPTCDDMRFYLINKFDLRIKGNLLKTRATALINIFNR
jgi:hypothetical protein